MRRAWIVALVLVVAVAGILLVLSRGGEEPPPRVDDAAAEAPVEEPEEDDLAFLFDVADASAARDPDEPGDRAELRAGPQDGDDPERWRRRRERFRERFRNMSPEGRRQWLRRRVQITALGEGEPTIAPEEVMAALRETRGLARDCMREHGGFRALREAMRRSAGADGGVRRGLTVSFDVTADGALDETSIAIEPPPPEPFYGCFADALLQAQLPPPGGEGARVDVRLGGGRGRRFRPGGPSERRGPSPTEPEEPR